jgi:hypothetical protein
VIRSLAHAGASLEEIARPRKRKGLLINVFLILVLGLILSVNSAITSAAFSSSVMARIPSSQPPSPTATAGKTPTESTTHGEDARAIPLTLIDLVATFVVALIPALIRALFILARRHLLRKREQIEWPSPFQLTLQEAWLNTPGEEDVDIKEQEERFDESVDDALQQLLSAFCH